MAFQVWPIIIIMLWNNQLLTIIDIYGKQKHIFRDIRHFLGQITCQVKIMDRAILMWLRDRPDCDIQRIHHQPTKFHISNVK